MYEDNCQPFPEAEAFSVFAEQIAEICRLASPDCSPRFSFADAFQKGSRVGRIKFAALCRGLLLPGSGVAGLERLSQLVKLAEKRHSCLLCMNHQSNFDVPTLYALLEDHGAAEIFERILWVSGRKLDEDVGPTRLLANCFPRVVLTPKSWFLSPHDELERSEALRMNMRAYRAIHQLRRRGWLLALFPAGTRTRLGQETMPRAIEEIDSYLKYSDFVVMGRIDGCTLPAVRDHDLAREIPRRDRVRYSFGPIMNAAEWRASAAQRFPELSQRQASARAVMEDIALVSSGEPPHLGAGMGTGPPVGEPLNE